MKNLLYLSFSMLLYCGCIEAPLPNEISANTSPSPQEFSNSNQQPSDSIDRPKEEASSVENGGGSETETPLVSNAGQDRTGQEDLEQEDTEQDVQESGLSEDDMSSPLLSGSEVPQDVPSQHSCTMDWCGNTCTDLSSDPLNCGGCGFTCRLTHAYSDCAHGSCVINQCMQGYTDADGISDNGCEEQQMASQCTAGIECVTSCMTSGSTVCDEGEERCMPPDERCDLNDQDCDGRIDEAIDGCRTGIHRGYQANPIGHAYTDRLNQLADNNYRIERENYFYLYSEQVANTRPVFLCKTSIDQLFLSNQTNCGIGRGPLRVLGFWAANEDEGSQTTPLFGFRHRDSGAYFYTKSASERNTVNTMYNFEDIGIVGHVWTNP